MKKIISLSVVFFLFILKSLAQSGVYSVAGPDTIVKGLNYQYFFEGSGLSLSSTITWSCLEDSKNKYVKLKGNGSTNQTFYRRGISLNVIDHVYDEGLPSIPGWSKTQYQYLTLFGSVGWQQEAKKKVILDAHNEIYPITRRPFCHTPTVFSLKYLPSDVTIRWETSDNMVIISGQGERSVVIAPNVIGNNTDERGQIKAIVTQGSNIKEFAKINISLVPLNTKSTEIITPLVSNDISVSPYSVKVISFPLGNVVYQKNKVTHFNIEDLNLKSGGIYIVVKSDENGIISSEKYMRK